MAEAIDCGWTTRVHDVVREMNLCEERLADMIIHLSYVVGHDNLTVKSLADVARRLKDGALTLTKVTQAKLDADGAFARQMSGSWLKVAERTLGEPDQR